MITEMKAGHLKDIDKPSEPFEVIGKIIPRYENEVDLQLLYEAPYLKATKTKRMKRMRRQIALNILTILIR